MLFKIDRNELESSEARELFYGHEAEGGICSQLLTRPHAGTPWFGVTHFDFPISTQIRNPPISQCTSSPLTPSKMEPIEYTYYEETADESSGDVAAANGDKLPHYPEFASSSSRSSDYTSASDSSEDEEEEYEQDELDGDEESSSTSSSSQDDQEAEDEEPSVAPSFKIPSRTIAAVEHPFLLMNINNGLETFGPNAQYHSVSQTLRLDMHVHGIDHDDRFWIPMFLSCLSPCTCTQRTLPQDQLCLTTLPPITSSLR